MIKRFCDRLAQRMTGKALNGEERKGGIAPDSGSSALSCNAPEYRPAADATVWLFLGAGMASGVGFLEAASCYHLKKDLYHADRMMWMSLWQIGADPTFPDPQLQMSSLIALINSKNDLAHAHRIRNTEYYIAAGIGGFAAVMFTVFIGRTIAAAVRDGGEAAKGSLSIEVSSRFADKVPEDVRTPHGFGLGLAMRF